MAFNLFARIGSMKFSTLLVIISVFIVLFSVIYRDYSWSRSVVSLKNENLGLQKNVDSYKLRFLIDELTYFKCDNKDEFTGICIYIYIYVHICPYIFVYVCIYV
jgi:hypothetical protein